MKFNKSILTATFLFLCTIIAAEVVPDLVALSKQMVRPKERPVNMWQYDNAQISASLVTERKLRELFEMAKQMSYVTYKYTEDGCIIRAHAISLMLEREGYITAKVSIE